MLGEGLVGFPVASSIQSMIVDGYLLKVLQNLHPVFGTNRFRMKLNSKEGFSSVFYSHVQSIAIIICGPGNFAIFFLFYVGVIYDPRMVSNYFERLGDICKEGRILGVLYGLHLSMRYLGGMNDLY